MVNAMDKFAVIAYIAQANEGKNPLGKKAFQKIVHLSSELFEAPLGYDFTLYTYGPFSRELAGDIDLLGSMKILSVEFDDVRNGYQITAAENASSVISDRENFIASVKSKIDAVIEKFGGRLAKELELLSMIVFIKKHKLADFNHEEAVIQKFLEIKPHYHKEDVQKGLAELKPYLIN